MADDPVAVAPAPARTLAHLRRDPSRNAVEERPAGPQQRDPALELRLRATSPASALIGSALSLMGLVVLAAGALPQVATAPISDLYHAPGATPDDLIVFHLSVGGKLIRLSRESSPAARRATAS